MKKSLLISITFLTSTLTFAEGQTGLAFFILSSFIITALVFTFIGGSLILITRKLLKHKTTKRIVISTYLIALIASALFAIINPIGFLSILFI